METKYISCADTAKLIRQALKEAFPDVKFSVRSKTYSGGASINIDWTDGPNGDQVDAVAKVFEGSYFDGMTDYKGSCYHLLDGQETSFGANFIFCNRDYTDDSIQRAIDSFYTEYQGNFKLYGFEKPTVEQYKNGDLWTMQIFTQGVPYSENVQNGVRKLLHKHSDRLDIPASNTASKVIYLGNDGYSQVGSLTKGVLK